MAPNRVLTAIFRLAAAALLAFLPASLAFAQRPELPDEEKFGRQADDFTFSFCVDPRDPGWQVDLAIGNAIAETLLLEPRPFVIDDTNARLAFDDVYRRLRGDCRIFFGFKLLPEGYPDWVAVTRPYYETGYVMVAPPPVPAELGAMPPSAAIAVPVASAADFRFVQYNNALPAERRHKRFPYGTDAEALNAVAVGQAAAALVWGPAFSHLRKSEPAFAGFAEFPAAPLQLPPVAVGAILLGTDTFLRASVDEAVTSLAADGTIARILADEGMPGRAPR